MGKANIRTTRRASSPASIDALPTLEQALTRSGAKRKILLGNGFSIAWQNDIFSYGSLYDRADFSRVSDEAKQAFDTLGTRDFEIVMRRLRDSASLLELYLPKATKTIAKLRADADGLRDLLVQTIADNHPARPSDVQRAQYAACREFLSNFEDIYTLNYDLLLYWTLMQDDASLAPVECDDGFRTDPDDLDAEWVTWDSAARSQSVHYLHGALHMYDAGADVQKYTWTRSGIALIDQIRAALAEHKFPLFVAEDTAENKAEKIAHSHCLSRAYRSLESIQKPLFTFGFGFGDADRHIRRAIAKSKVTDLWVGLYGNPAEPSNKATKAAANAIAVEREHFHPSNPLSVYCYDAGSVRVWG